MKKSVLKPKRFFKRQKKPLLAHKADKIGNNKFKQFPRIFLTFTEKFFLVGLVSFVLLLIIIIVSLDLYKDIGRKQRAETERQEIIKELQFWQSAVNKYKDYRDGYFQLAVLEYRIGDFAKAKLYLQKALVIDPNFEKGRELERILSTR